MILTRSRIIQSRHAFSTRDGGISRSDHTKSLNLAFGRGDSDETVIKNLELFAQNVGVDPKSIISLPQTHSATVHKVDGSVCGYGYYIRDDNVMCIHSGDGYVTNDKSITLGVKSADCTPILLEAYDASSVIAIGAVHAGWRGTVQRIAGVCVDMLVSEFGADRSHIRAAIGPAIQKCCFEVGSDVKNAVCALGDGYDIYIKEKPNSKEKYMCDMAGINRRILTEAGLSDSNIDMINECTCCMPQKYFSHRYSNGNRGTMLSVISMA